MPKGPYPYGKLVTGNGSLIQFVPYCQVDSSYLN